VIAGDRHWRGIKADGLSVKNWKLARWRLNALHTDATTSLHHLYNKPHQPCYCAFSGTATIGISSPDLFLPRLWITCNSTLTASHRNSQAHANEHKEPSHRPLNLRRADKQLFHLIHTQWLPSLLLRRLNATFPAHTSTRPLRRLQSSLKTLRLCASSLRQALRSPSKTQTQSLRSSAQHERSMTLLLPRRAFLNWRAMSPRA